MILPGATYYCHSWNVIGFQLNDLAEVLFVNAWADSIDIKRLSCLSKLTMPLSTFEANFTLNIGELVSTPSLDDFIGAGLTTSCHCGVDKTYAGQDTTGLHSFYCPKFKASAR